MIAPIAVMLTGGAPGLAAFYLRFLKSGYTMVLLSNYDPEEVAPVVLNTAWLLEPEMNPRTAMRMKQNSWSSVVREGARYRENHDL